MCKAAITFEGLRASADFDVSSQDAAVDSHTFDGLRQLKVLQRLLVDVNGSKILESLLPEELSRLRLLAWLAAGR